MQISRTGMTVNNIQFAQQIKYDFEFTHGQFRTIYPVIESIIQQVEPILEGNRPFIIYKDEQPVRIINSIKDLKSFLMTF